MTENEWRTKTDRRLDSIEKLLQDILIEDATSTQQRKNMDKRLAGIEDTNKWLIRLVISGIIGGLLAFIFTGGMAP